MNIFFILCAAMQLITARGNAYVTSATLEYSYPHPTHIYLNGIELKTADSIYPHFEDYTLMCSADGSLPLELLKYGTENVLAFIQTNSGVANGPANMGISYRLTFRQSSGSTFVVWSEPENTKLVRLQAGEHIPENWFRLEFKDAAWKNAFSSRLINDMGGWPELADLKFKGPLGQEGAVPFLSHSRGGEGNAGMVDLFRSVFRIPDEKNVLKVYSTPRANNGENVQSRIYPSSECASMGRFEISATLPLHLESVQSRPSTNFDPASRRLIWNFPPSSRTLTLQLESVDENNGFVQPEKALGSWMPDRLIPSRLRRNVTSTEYLDSATFPSNASCWYKVSKPPFADGSGSPVILDVTFQSEIFPAGKNSLSVRTLEQIMFNYSLDGGRKGVIFDDTGINVARNSGPCLAGEWKWTNGYYDATGDRKWNWTNLSNLKVRFSAKQVGVTKRENRLLRCIVNIRYYNPAEVSPEFFGKIEGSECRLLTVSASISSLANNMSSIGLSTVLANAAKCDSSMQMPAPRTPSVVRAQTTVGIPILPTATPTAGGIQLIGARLSIKNIVSRPEPFRKGGVYVYFYAIKNISSLTFNVYDNLGRQVASFNEGAFKKGNNSLFFGGLDNKHRDLVPGSYQYEFAATADGFKESTRGIFTKVEEKYK
jgi:hypothetical protein